MFLKAAEIRKSPKTCGNRKIKKNVAENRKKQFFSAESRKRTPYYPPSIIQSNQAIKLFKCPHCALFLMSKEDCAKHVKSHEMGSKKSDLKHSLNQTVPDNDAGENRLIIDESGSKKSDLNEKEKQGKSDLNVKKERRKSDLNVKKEPGTSDLKEKKKPGNQLFRCSICSKTFQSNSLLVWHMELHPKSHRSQEPAFICHKCGKTCKDKKEFDRHNRIHRLNDKAVSQGRLRCDACLKPFSCLSILERHKPKGQDGLKCSVCGQTLGCRRRLIDHLDSHGKDGVFSCPWCIKTFENKFVLERHCVLHTDRDRFKCRICFQSFGCGPHLKNHIMKIHGIDQSEMGALEDNTSGNSESERHSLKETVPDNNDGENRLIIDESPLKLDNNRDLQDKGTRIGEERPLSCQDFGGTFKGKHDQSIRFRSDIKAGENCLPTDKSKLKSPVSVKPLDADRDLKDQRTRAAHPPGEKPIFISVRHGLIKIVPDKNARENSLAMDTSGLKSQVSSKPLDNNRDLKDKGTKNGEESPFVPRQDSGRTVTGKHDLSIRYTNTNNSGGKSESEGHGLNQTVPGKNTGENCLPTDKRGLKPPVSAKPLDATRYLKDQRTRAGEDPTFISGRHALIQTVPDENARENSLPTDTSGLKSPVSAKPLDNNRDLKDQGTKNDEESPFVPRQDSGRTVKGKHDQSIRYTNPNNTGGKSESERHGLVQTVPDKNTGENCLPTDKRGLEFPVCAKPLNNNGDLKDQGTRNGGEPSFLSCQDSERTFKGKHDLSIRHTNTDRYVKCVVCSERFWTPSDLASHMSVHSEAHPFSCKFCPLKFKRQRECDRHMIIHTNPDRFKCGICLQSFGCNSELKRHVNIHSKEYPFLCKYCPTRYKLQSELERHSAIHTLPDKTVGKPQFGTSKLTFPKRFSSNVSWKKKTMKSQKLRKVKFPSRARPKTLKRKDENDKHVSGDTHPCKFICGICFQLFDSRDHVQHHLKSHQESNPKPSAQLNSNLDPPQQSNINPYPITTTSVLQDPCAIHVEDPNPKNVFVNTLPNRIEDEQQVKTNNIWAGSLDPSSPLKHDTIAHSGELQSLPSPFLDSPKTPKRNPTVFVNTLPNRIEHEQQMNTNNVWAETFGLSSPLEDDIHSEEPPSSPPPCPDSPKTLQGKHLDNLIPKTVFINTLPNRMEQEQQINPSNVWAASFNPSSPLKGDIISPIEEPPPSLPSSPPPCLGSPKTLKRKQEFKFKCNICHQFFNRRRHLEEHKATHSNARPFSCSYCLKTFKLERERDLHTIIHTDPDRHKCNVCLKSFYCRSRLRYHVKKHKKEFPFSCRHCQAVYKTWGECETHSENCTVKTAVEDKMKSRGSAKTVNRRKKLQKSTKTFKRTFEKVQCDVCFKIFNRHDRLKNHMTVHSDEFPFSCALCQRKFKLKYQFDKHLLSHSDPEKFKLERKDDYTITCGNCGQLFSRPGYLRMHMKRCKIGMQEKKPSTEGIMNLSKQSNLSSVGVMVGSVNNRVACTKCNRHFAEQKHLERHVQLKHPEMEESEAKRRRVVKVTSTGEIPCTECKETFPNMTDFAKHTLLHTSPDMKCLICDKSFDNFRNLKSHLARHSNYHSFTCVHCETRFKHKTHLKRHIRNFHPDQEFLDTFQCCKCDQTFDTREQLKVHKETAEHRLIFPCRHCPNLTFKSKYEREKHALTHRDPDRFRCRICLKSFGFLKQLKDHAPTHSDKRPFTCYVCQKTFKRKSHLNSHKLSHTEPDKFKCKFCLKSFGW